MAEYKIDIEKSAQNILNKIQERFGISAERLVELTSAERDGRVMVLPAQAGEPLTLEQLRKMDGECVKVVIDGVEPLEMLALVEVPKGEDCVLLRNNLGGVSGFYNNDDLREDGVKAYAYPPAHIDREAWTAE